MGPNMKYLLACLLSIFGCAGSNPNVAEAPKPPETRLSLSLIGTNSIGHACAVDGLVLTAGHIATAFYGGQQHFYHYTWTDGSKSGWLMYLNHARARDLGALSPYSGNTPDYLYRQMEAAEVGQYVSWYEYVYEEGQVLNVIRREGRVERLQAGHIIVDEAPTQGASGSCLLSDKNEVVGIIIWSLYDHTGLSVDLTGQWWPFLEEE